MADDKIVTKKTAAKPAATTNRKAPAKAASSARTVSKKAVSKPAAPAIAAPGMTKAGAAAAAAARSAATPSPAGSALMAQNPVATKLPPGKAVHGEPPLADPNVRPAPLEEKPVSFAGLADVSSEQRLAMIREAAYYKAEKRGFTGGNDAQDWADAEREIDELLAKARAIYGA
jgi:hypothetical protein